MSGETGKGGNHWCEPERTVSIHFAIVLAKREYRRC